METKFNIISTCYNVEKWIKSHIYSVKNQTYSNFTHYVIDDRSTDNTWNILTEIKQNTPEYSSKLQIGQPSFKGGNLFNQWQLLTWYNLDPNSVIVHLDGDDWLKDSEVLTNLAKIYEEDSKLLATYGNYETTDGSPSICQEKPAAEPYRDAIIKGWKYSHLRTYRKFLFNHIKEEDLKDSKGKFFQFAPDVAIFLPILEMAAERVKFCNRINVVYNRHNDLNEDKVSLYGQASSALEIYQKPSYLRLNL